MSNQRDHGGGLDAAIAAYGGTREDWIDLSTGINPIPYPIGEISKEAWGALPDAAAHDRLIKAARTFWSVPDGAVILPAAGASALIARMPALSAQRNAYIPGPTYNEHQAAFVAHGQSSGGDDPSAPVHVYVHPNNPDGKLWPATQIGGRALTVIDESFCDVMPEASHIAQTKDRGFVILKSFGKFWGLAGLRLGFAIGSAETLQPKHGNECSPELGMKELLGPWAVSGPALEIGARALADVEWAAQTRRRLRDDRTKLDGIMSNQGRLVGGTNLFGLYEVSDAQEFQEKLAKKHIWSRIFPYSQKWVRLGLPRPDQFDRLAQAVGD